MAVTSSRRSRITRGSWSWKAQPTAAPPARSASSSRAERDAGEDHAGGISQCLAPRRRLGLAGAGEAQRLQAEDREDAGHDVEDQAAEQRAEQGEEQARPAAAPFPGRRAALAGRDRRAGGGHLAAAGRCSARPAPSPILSTPSRPASAAARGPAAVSTISISPLRDRLCGAE